MANCSTMLKTESRDLEKGEGNQGQNLASRDRKEMRPASGRGSLSEESGIKVRIR